MEIKPLDTINGYFSLKNTKTRIVTILKYDN